MVNNLENRNIKYKIMKY